MSNSSASIAVVIPCYRVADSILGVIRAIGPEVGWIYVVDDACPESSGDKVEQACSDPRVKVIRHSENRGVGGATVRGFAAACDSDARVVVKLDGDGQMKPELIPALCQPVLSGDADYAKGNRFYFVSDVQQMPKVRLLGNAVLSFMTKLSSGYWQLFDPTNGFVAIERRVLSMLDLSAISPRYFFETDLLYHLNQARAVVAEMPMRAVYGQEKSGLSPLGVLPSFLWGNVRNTARRIFHSYFLRGFSPASVELVLGIALLLFGVLFGGWQWWQSSQTGLPATAGTVMLAALPVLVGLQLLLSWLNFDIVAEPRLPLQQRLAAISLHERSQQRRA